ncbi:NAD(P)-dependent oxidoreductase [Fertoebacter nigrum]|uniref:NAD(P)-dependent oxidoreductase n=1 Tax=Fertoeibacter niger TaxID=2656921 RepID=A0A8X8H3U9_9RHOB|nr:NAD(P)-dependent oxidoreductase [Fertoeibacter niger]NUB45854.1 NAD(P)-dependent oxidoreductase [Fertoeibacter niger]
MKVGFVGVGAMGLAMAGHALRAGHEVWATDVNPAQRAAARDAGLNVADDLAGIAAQAEVFIIVVVSDAQSETVTRGLLAAGLAPGSVIAISATNHPDTMVRLHAECAAQGVGFVDAPVVYGLQGAVDGDLGTYCGGSAEDVARLRPALESYSRFVEHVGAIGSGQLAKTCNNMMHWAMCVANYEVLLLAKRYGLDAQKMRELLLKSPARNTTLERWDSTNFTWHEKDMDVALELSQAGALPLPFFGQVDQMIKLLSPAKVKALLYGPEAEYLGGRVVPLTAAEGGFGAPASA